MLILQAKYIRNYVVELANGDWLGVDVNGRLGEIVNVIVNNENGIPWGIVLNPNFVDYVRTVEENTKKTSTVRTELATRIDVIEEGSGGQSYIPLINCITNETPNNTLTVFTFKTRDLISVTNYIQYSSKIYLNGLRQSLFNDYIEIFSLGKIIFIQAPKTGDIIIGDFDIINL